MFTVGKKKIELFGHNDETYPQRSQHKAFKPKNTDPTAKHGGGSIMLCYWCIAQSGRNNEGGILPNVSTSPQINRWLKLGHISVSQLDNDPKCTKTGS